MELIRTITWNESQEIVKVTRGEFNNYFKRGNDYYCYIKHSGIRVILQFRRNVPVVLRVIINLNSVNGGDDNVLSNPKFQNLSEVFLATDIALEEENLNLCLSQFKVGRVDFSVDVQMDSDEEVMAYIALAKRKGLDKNYRNKYKEIEVFTLEEQKKLVQESYNHRYGVFIRLVFVTGLRIGELLGLQWQDIDFVNSCISIKRTLNRLNTYSGKKKTEIVLDTPKSKNSARVIPISAGALEDLCTGTG